MGRRRIHALVGRSHDAASRVEIAQGMSDGVDGGECCVNVEEAGRTGGVVGRASRPGPVNLIEDATAA
jgi:hypothetical protein